MLLSDVMRGKDNNLNLVRFIAAFSVLVSHSFVLSSGLLLDEPLRGTLGMSLGDVAVDIFFMASGFLVSRSLAQRGSGVEFVWARMLRIYPALIAMVLLCVFAVAPLFGDRGIGAVLADHGTWFFVMRNVTLVRGVALSLPDVFLRAPWKGIVNGSLWTMTYEVRLYLSLVGFWWVLAPLRAARPSSFKVACVAVAASAFVWHAWTLYASSVDVNGLVDPVPRLVLMFYSGAAWWVVSRRVVLDLRALAAGGALVAALRLAGAAHAFHIAYAMVLPYAVCWAAFVPSGKIRGFNRIGDCSYGIYIYAFPVQQMWVSLFPGGGPWLMIAGAGTATVALGLLSWHLLEKRALSLKDLPRRLFPVFARI